MGSMRPLLRSRQALIAAFLFAVLLLGAGVWRYGYIHALGQLGQRGAADLTLASDRVTSQLQRYRGLAVLMADHPVIPQLYAGAEPDAANALFERVADKTGALEVLYVEPSGAVQAAAREAAGARMAQTDYLRRALTGALGAGHAVAGLLNQRAYYLAAPFFTSVGDVGGAVVVAVDIGEIEWDWTGANPAVFFTDEAGLVFISNRSELTYWQRPPGAAGLVAPKGPELPFDGHYVQEHEIWTLGRGPYFPADARAGLGEPCPACAGHAG